MKNESEHELDDYFDEIEARQSRIALVIVAVVILALVAIW